MRSRIGEVRTWNFDTTDYRAHNTDVAAARVNPLTQYLEYHVAWISRS
jgi:hypothetical protein